MSMYKGWKFLENSKKEGQKNCDSRKRSRRSRREDGPGGEGGRGHLTSGRMPEQIIEGKCPRRCCGQWGRAREAQQGGLAYTESAEECAWAGRCWRALQCHWRAPEVPRWRRSSRSWAICHTDKRQLNNISITTRQKDEQNNKWETWQVALRTK